MPKKEMQRDIYQHRPVGDEEQPQQAQLSKRQRLFGVLFASLSLVASAASVVAFVCLVGWADAFSVFAVGTGLGIGSVLFNVVAVTLAACSRVIASATITILAWVLLASAIACVLLDTPLH